MAIPRLSPQVTGIGRVLEPDRHLQRSRIGGHGVQQQQSADTAFSNSKVSRNHAGIHGGGIYNQGELDATGTQVSRNRAPSGGGGIYDDGPDTAHTLTHSTITGNKPDNCEPPGSISNCTR